MKVGPESAGAYPGPACYGFGGNDPTVTDAVLILGYRNPDYFLGGEMALRVDLARKAMEEKLADPLGISIEAAAVGVNRIVTENMAMATRIHISEKGKDPRNYDLIAFGGAGRIDAFRIAEIMKLKRIICPAAAGAASARDCWWRRWPWIWYAVTWPNWRVWIGTMLSGFLMRWKGKRPRFLWLPGSKVKRSFWKEAQRCGMPGSFTRSLSSIPAGNLGRKRSPRLGKIFIGPMTGPSAAT